MQQENTQLKIGSCLVDIAQGNEHASVIICCKAIEWIAAQSTLVQCLRTCKISLVHKHEVSVYCVGI